MSDAHPVSDKSTFDALPAALARVFDGDDLAAKAGFTVSLITSDAASHLQTSLLGVGEVFAPLPHSICFALWPKSRAVANLRRSARGTMTFVLDGAFYQLQLHTREVANPSGENGLVFFAGHLEQGEAQRVAYARLTSGISFELAGDMDAVLARWRKQVAALKGLPPA